MTRGQDFNGEVTKVASYSHACNSSKVTWFSKGQSTQQHPLGDSDTWKMTFLSCQLWSLMLKLPVLQILVLLVVCDLLCLGREATEIQGGLCPRPVSAQRPNHGLWHKDAFYTGRICLAEDSRFVTQHEPSLSLVSLMATYPARAHFSSSWRNLAEKWDPNKDLGGALSTADRGRGNNCLCNKDVFPHQWTSYQSSVKQDMVNWQKVPVLECNWRVVFHIWLKKQSEKFLIKKGKEREFPLPCLSP